MHALSWAQKRYVAASKETDVFNNITTQVNVFSDQIIN